MSDPSLSVICTIGPRRHRARRVAEAIGAQTAVADLELIFVDTSPDRGPPPDSPSIATTVVPYSAGRSLGEARATGLSAARGEAVAFLADHCHPEPNWAEALIRGYRDDGLAALGYAFVNANPETYGSRSSMLADFGPWLAPSESAEVEYLPPHDVSYRRSVLTERGIGVSELLTAEPLLLEDLRRRGHRLAASAEARTRHACLRTVSANAGASFDYCRALAAIQVRRERWWLPRRVLQAAMSAFGAPTLRSAQTVRTLIARSMTRQALTALPGILSQHLSAGAGQAWGYLAGGGDAATRFLQREVTDVRDD